MLGEISGQDEGQNPYREATRRLARDRHLPLVDIDTGLREHGIEPLPDGIHPNLGSWINTERFRKGEFRQGGNENVNGSASAAPAAAAAAGTAAASGAAATTASVQKTDSRSE